MDFTFGSYPFDLFGECKSFDKKKFILLRLGIDIINDSACALYFQNHLKKRNKNVCAMLHVAITLDIQK